MTYAKKSLGQNFLRSQSALKTIVSAGKVEEGDIVLEIGPGRGALTAKLLGAGANVVAIEKDRMLISVLSEKFEQEIKSKKLVLIEGDILEMDAKKLKLKDYKLIANIPYYITGAVIRKFLEEKVQPELMVLLLQKEVAERIVAKSSNGQHGKESILSIAVKAYCVPRYVSKVSRKSFSPAPNVDSAIVAFENISKSFFKENKISEGTFFEVMKSGFAHKRKKLGSNLKNVAQKLNPAVLVKLRDKRAEELSLADWQNLLI